MPVLLPGLSHLRTARGLTQEALARKAELSSSTISKHESGEVLGISAATLDALVKALECERHDLFLPHNSEIPELKGEA